MLKAIAHDYHTQLDGDGHVCKPCQRAPESNDDGLECWWCLPAVMLIVPACRDALQKYRYIPGREQGNLLCRKPAIDTAVDFCADAAWTSSSAPSKQRGRDFIICESACNRLINRRLCCKDLRHIFGDEQLNAETPYVHATLLLPNEHCCRGALAMDANHAVPIMICVY